jgi:hypothetical protein
VPCPILRDQGFDFLRSPLFERCRARLFDKQSADPAFQFQFAQIRLAPEWVDRFFLDV